MSKSSFVKARIEPELKVQAEAIFAELGMTPSQVITMLYKHVSREHEVPIPLHLPNAETIKAIQEARERVDVNEYKSADELFSKFKD